MAILTSKPSLLTALMLAAGLTLALLLSATSVLTAEIAVIDVNCALPVSIPS